MNKLALTFLLIAVVLTFTKSASAAYARCTCQGRCGTFSCDPNNTRGCDCVNCRCIRGSIGFRTCCKDRCGFWGNKRKCHRCKLWQTCDCSGCRNIG